MFDNLNKLGLERSCSTSTVSSSVAAEDIRQQLENFRNVPKVQTIDTTNTKIKNIESVSIIYHNNYFNHASSNALKSSKKSPKTVYLDSLKKPLCSIEWNTLFRRKKAGWIAVILTIGNILTTSCIATYYSLEKSYSTTPYEPAIKTDEPTTTVTYSKDETSTESSLDTTLELFEPPLTTESKNEQSTITSENDSSTKSFEFPLTSEKSPITTIVYKPTTKGFEPPFTSTTKAWKKDLLDLHLKLGFNQRIDFLINFNQFYQKINKKRPFSTVLIQPL
ncbi:unnamed protein product [Chironomus riparius]|uniref:Uncharacterized protein n=1 Tax=Chironomus riparius TaxID=315576 RepID=A0A9P0IV16_9DIPT|nr:unnamed protein product [Chironomus riparius]